jgi:AbrB family looped-hinge helix DNA binding protein
MQSYTVKVQKGGRITIPAPIRHALGLQPGDLLKFRFHRGKIICTPQK